MKTWMQWHGGISYACPTQDDTEEFDSLTDAREAFRHRQQDSDPYYPCVEDSSAWLFFSDPREASDPYPDRVLSVGPRGGVREERG